MNTDEAIDEFYERAYKCAGTKEVNFEELVGHILPRDEVAVLGNIVAVIIAKNMASFTKVLDEFLKYCEWKSKEVPGFKIVGVAYCQQVMELCKEIPPLARLNSFMSFAIACSGLEIAPADFTFEILEKYHKNISDAIQRGSKPGKNEVVQKDNKEEDDEDATTL